MASWREHAADAGRRLLAIQILIVTMPRRLSILGSFVCVWAHCQTHTRRRPLSWSLGLTSRVRRVSPFPQLKPSMSRHLGLRSHYVMVDRDYQNRLVYHACAGVFVDGGAILVDPAYSWFGVQHNRTYLQGDTQSPFDGLRAGLEGCQATTRKKPLDAPTRQPRAGPPPGCNGS